MFISFVDSPFVSVDGGGGGGNVFNASVMSTLLSALSNGNSFGEKIDLLKLLLRSIPAATALATVALAVVLSVFNEIISVSVAAIELMLLALVFTGIRVVALRLDLKILFV